MNVRPKIKVSALSLDETKVGGKSMIDESLSPIELIDESQILVEKEEEVFPNQSMLMGIQDSSLLISEQSVAEIDPSDSSSHSERVVSQTSEISEQLVQVPRK